MRNAPVLAINAVDGTTDPVSNWIPSTQLFAFSASCKLSGSMAGTLKVQVSDDSPNTAQASIVGSDLSSATVTVAAGSIGNIPALISAYNWIRVVFTHSGGAGTITSKVTGSGF